MKLLLFTLLLIIKCILGEDSGKATHLKKKKNQFEQIISELKEKLPENTKNKDKFTTENVSNLVSSILEGDTEINNLYITRSTNLNNATILKELNVDTLGSFTEEINIQGKITIGNILSISKKEIIIDPNSEIKISDFPLKYKAKDLFELLSFMKFINTLCKDEKGKLSKCDFTSLLKQ